MAAGRDPAWEEQLSPKLMAVAQQLCPRRNRLPSRLNSNHLINEDEEESFNKSSKSEKDLAVELLDLLRKKGPGSFDKFCQVLLEVGDKQLSAVERLLRPSRQTAATNSSEGQQLAETKSLQAAARMPSLEDPCDSPYPGRASTAVSFETEESIASQLSEVEIPPTSDGNRTVTTRALSAIESQLSVVHDSAGTAVASSFAGNVFATNVIQGENVTVEQNIHYQLPTADKIHCYTPDVPEPFVGRDKIVDVVAKALRDGKQSIRLITGPPGIGKSTVANAVCAQYLEICQPKTKCYSIEFSTAVDTTEDLYGVVCSCFSFYEPPSETAVRSLLNVLPPNAILLIDACEKAKPQVINDLLTMARLANGELRFLLTSQVQLTRKEIDVKLLMRVDKLEPLSDEDALQILRQPMEEAGIDTSCKEIVDIGNLLDGNPYALTLAAVMLSEEFTPLELLQSLTRDGREMALSDSKGNTLCLKTLFFQFFNLLKKEGETEYLSAISAAIFCGKITRDSFNAVCESVHSASSSGSLPASTVTTKLIGKLVRWHVLQRCRDSTDPNNPRYQLHSYMKEHALGLLKNDSDLIFKVREAFLMYFAHFLEKTAREEEMRKTLQDKGGLFALDEEYSNVEEFLTQLTDPQNIHLIQQSSTLVDAMFREDVNHLLSFRFLHEKRRHMLKCLYNIVCTGTLSANAWEGQLAITNILCGQGKYSEALHEAKQGLELCDESSENKQRRARCLEVVGTVLLCQHHTGFSEAEKCLREAYELLRAHILENLSKDDRRMCMRHTASVCRKLGELYTRQMKFDDAKHMLNECRSHFAQFSGQETLSYVWLYHRIGGNLQAQGKRKEAESEYLEGLKLCHEYKATRHPIFAKLNYSLGRLYLYRETKDIEKSLKHFNNALSLQTAIDPNHLDVAQTYIGIGRVYNEMAGSDSSKAQAALETFQKAKKILEENELDTGEYPDLRMAELYSSQAYSHRQLKKFDDELKSLQQALNVYRKQPTPNDSLKHKMATCLTDVGHAYKRLGKPKEAGKFFAESRKLGGKAKGRQK